MLLDKFGHQIIFFLIINITPSVKIIHSKIITNKNGEPYYIFK